MKIKMLQKNILKIKNEITKLTPHFWLANQWSGWASCFKPLLDLHPYRTRETHFSPNPSQFFESLSIQTVFLDPCSSDFFSISSIFCVLILLFLLNRMFVYHCLFVQMCFDCDEFVLIIRVLCRNGMLGDPLL